jgi:hypothetical protein
VFIAALFTIFELQKQPRCPTTNEWTKKMWYIYTTEFYSAIKKKEILSFAGKWMELENIIISEVSQRPQVFLSYVEYRPNTNTRKTGHTMGGHIRERESKRRKLKR